MNLIGGRLLRREEYCWWICIHEKHWSDEMMVNDDPRDDPDICWECIDESGILDKKG